MKKETALVHVAKTPTESTTIARHNNLIEAHYYASPQEQRLFLWAVSQAQEGLQGSQVLRVEIAELARFVGIEKNANIYAQMMEVTDRVTSRKVRIRNLENGEYVQANLMNARYRVGSGFVEVELSQFVLPYIIQLKKNFALVDLKYVMRLASGHAMRIYDLLKSRSYRSPRVEIGVDDLQAMLGTTEKYDRFNNFRERVLETSCAEINRITDMTVTFNVLLDPQDKRRASKIAFDVRYGRTKTKPESALVARLVRAGLRESEAETWVREYATTDSERITWHLEELERRSYSGEIKAPAAWLRAGLRDDYRPKQSQPEIGDRVVDRQTKTARFLAEGEASRVSINMRQDAIAHVVSQLSASETEEWIEAVAKKLTADVVKKSWTKSHDLTSPAYAKWVAEVAKERTGIDLMRSVSGI